MLITSTNMSFMSPARHLGVMTVLLSQPHLKIQRCNTLNPATLLPTQEDGDPHKCEVRTAACSKPRPDLEDTPLEDGTHVYVDGSASKSPTGRNLVGYAVVTDTAILEAKRLPCTHSAQTAELTALTRACELFTGQKVTIFTDSQYAFSTLHTYAAQWARRGMKTSSGKPVEHAKLLTTLINAVQLPEKIAVCKCKAHTKGTDRISQGNHKADQAAKDAAMQGTSAVMALTKDPKDTIPKQVLIDMQEHAPPKEKQQWKMAGAVQTDDGLHHVDGKPCLPRSLYPLAAKLSHGVSHVSTGGMVTITQQSFHTTPGLNTYFKNFCRSCMTCCRHNSQGNVRPKRGQTPHGTYPFQIVHMDFIELSRSGKYRYCLVLIDSFSKW